MSKKKILSGFPVRYPEDEITLNLLVWRNGWDPRKQEPGTARNQVLGAGSEQLGYLTCSFICAPSEHTSTA